MSRLVFSTDADETGFLNVNMQDLFYSCEFPFDYIQEVTNNYVKKQDIENFKSGENRFLYFTNSGNIGVTYLKYSNNNLLIVKGSGVGIGDSYLELRNLSVNEKEQLDVFLDWLLTQF